MDYSSTQQNEIEEHADLKGTNNLIGLDRNVGWLHSEDEQRKDFISKRSYVSIARGRHQMAERAALT